MWAIIHQLEPGGYQCIGDYANDHNSSCLSHCPTTFDSTIIGMCDYCEKANWASLEYASTIGPNPGDGEEDDDVDNGKDSVMDFVGEGLFRDGADFGDVNTFSECVFVERRTVQCFVSQVANDAVPMMTCNTI